MLKELILRRMVAYESQENLVCSVPYSPSSFTEKKSQVTMWNYFCFLQRQFSITHIIYFIRKQNVLHTKMWFLKNEYSNYEVWD